MKRNDLVFFENELFVVMREVHCNVLDDPTPHMALEVRRLLENKAARLILDTDYPKLSLLAVC